MHAEAFPRRGDDDDLLMPVLMALALHAGLVALMILAGWWQPLPKTGSVAGPVVEAALVITAADVRILRPRPCRRPFTVTASF